MKRERADAMSLTARVERDSKEGVRRLRLTVRYPLLVGTALEVRIVEIDPGAPVTSRRQLYHTRALAFAARARAAP